MNSFLLPKTENIKILTNSNCLPSYKESKKALRKEQNTSYRWLAHKMGMSETTVSSMRKAGTEPRASEAAKIASALGTSVEFLVQDFKGDTPEYQETKDNYFFKYTHLKNELSKLLENFK
ncbi:MAG: helix-turn-helix transcriptional regulator [Treponema sp.]|nr:helix-turn-helix transcriptional regulator [Treponema sp.]